MILYHNLMMCSTTSWYLVSIVTKNLGGIAATAHKVCNYPGFKEISGFDLTQKMYEQATALNVPTLFEDIIKITKEDDLFQLHTTTNKIFTAKKVILALGTVRRKLNLPGEKEFYGKGVSYCATCDAAFYKDKKVIVVGGSDAALTAALLLSEYASEIHLVYRKGEFFRAEQAWVQQIEKEDKIQVHFNEEVTEIKGDKFVTQADLKSGKTLEVNGVFIEIGSEPDLKIIDGLEVKKERDYILTDANQETNIPGLFAAGDITVSEFKQIVVAAAHGAIATYKAYNDSKKSK